MLGFAQGNGALVDKDAAAPMLQANTDGATLVRIE
jgi:hypothetical protein